MKFECVCVCVRGKGSRLVTIYQINMNSYQSLSPSHTVTYTLSLLHN